MWYPMGMIRETAEEATELTEAIIMFQIRTAFRFWTMIVPEFVVDALFGTPDYHDSEPLTQ
jgi:hypothetical protein